MVKLEINGREVEAKKEQTLLEVCRENNIFIPTMCVNDAVEPYGACRLCMVEIEKRGRKKLVASCLFAAEEGLKVTTENDKIANIRQTVIELLMARCPHSPEVKEMADKLGVEKTRFDIDEGDNACVLCALCTRVCKEVVGRSAISLVNRGAEREVALPFYDDSNACIACGSCAYICPTQAITMEDKEDKRVIKMPHSEMEFKLKKCSKCSSYWAPEKQLDYMREKADLPADFFDVCPNCKD